MAAQKKMDDMVEITVLVDRPERALFKEAYTVPLGFEPDEPPERPKKGQVVLMTNLPKLAFDSM